MKNAVAKANLIHGNYYKGHCRNASVARWNAHARNGKGCFIYRRHKFGDTFLEEIEHPEDDQGFDIFLVEEDLGPSYTPEIPLEG